jgi:hypothetical protein
MSNETNKLLIEWGGKAIAALIGAGAGGVGEHFRVRRQEKAEARKLLALFNRSALQKPLQSEEPAAMYKSLKELYVGLRKGSSVVPLPKVKKLFIDAEKLIDENLGTIDSIYPEVPATVLENPTITPTVAQALKHKMEKKAPGRYLDCVRDMMKIRQPLNLILIELEGRLL